MKQRYSLSLIISLVLITQAFAQKMQESKSSYALRKPSGEPMATLMNTNKMTLGVKADGRLFALKSYVAKSPYSGYRTCWWSGIYPHGTAGIICQDGIIWGGMVDDGSMQLIRVGGSVYKSGLQPGRIISKGIAEDTTHSNVRIWRIRRDWQTADLTRDATEFFNIPEDSVTQGNIAIIRSQYEKDWTEWPWEKGAPFYDDNGNGIMDDGEEPGLAYADQVVWYVANDLNRDKALDFMGSFPIGLEMQVTLWAYNRGDHPSDEVLSNLNKALRHIIFKRVRLIYKGHSETPETARIDSMYIGQWSDPDLGDSNDDLVGCDTLLNMGFSYNDLSIDEQYHRYGLLPPAFGYCLLAGPVIQSPDQQAFYDMKIKNNYTNLPMTAFTWFTAGGPISDPSYDYVGALKYYNTLQGYQPFANRLVYYPHPPGMKSNHFPFSGDPVHGTGYNDGPGTVCPCSPQDRRLMCSSGPFTMALGDTQEVIIALVGGFGGDRLSNITIMKHNVKWAHLLTHSKFDIGFQEKEESLPVEKEHPSDFILYPNYPNPFNAGTEIRYDLPLEKNVKLVIYNVLGQKVKILVDGIQEADKYSYRWDGTNDLGEKVPSGIYFCRLEAGHWVLTRKMTLLE